MTSYEIFLLGGSFFGVLAICALASVVLDRGSFQIFFVLALVTGGALYMASQNSEDGIKAEDVPPAINKLIGEYIR